MGIVIEFRPRKPTQPAPEVRAVSVATRTPESDSEPVVIRVHAFVEGSEGAKAEAYRLYCQANTLDEDSRTVNEAKALYEQAIELDPTLGVAMVNLGIIHYRHRNRAALAIQWYRRAQEAEPDLAEAHYNEGYTLAEQGSHAYAVGCYLRALAIRPLFEDAHFNLGVSAYATRNYLLARKHFNEYMKLTAPGQGFYPEALAFLKRLDNPEPAIKATRKRSRRATLTKHQLNVLGTLRDNAWVTQASIQSVFAMGDSVFRKLANEGLIERQTRPTRVRITAEGLTALRIGYYLHEETEVKDFKSEEELRDWIARR